MEVSASLLGFQDYFAHKVVGLLCAPWGELAGTWLLLLGAPKENYVICHISQLLLPFNIWYLV